MTKGSYAVGEDDTTPPRKDRSYRSFICALLVFLFICLIILLVSINWGGKDEPGRHHAHHTGRLSTKKDDAEVVQQGRLRPNKTHEKMVSESTTLRNKITTTVFEKSKTLSTSATPGKDEEENKSTRTPAPDIGTEPTTKHDKQTYPTRIKQYHHDENETSATETNTDHEHILTDTSTTIYNNDSKSKTSKITTEEPTTATEANKIESFTSTTPSSPTDNGDSSTETTIMVKPVRNPTTPSSPTDSDDSSRETTTATMKQPASNTEAEQIEPLDSTTTSSFTDSDGSSTETTTTAMIQSASNREAEQIELSDSTTPSLFTDSEDSSTETTTTAVQAPVRNTKVNKIEHSDSTTTSSFTDSHDSSTETTAITMVKFEKNTKTNIDSSDSTTPSSFSDSDDSSTEITETAKAAFYTMQNEERSSDAGSTKTKEKASSSTTETTPMESDGLSDPPVPPPVCESAVCKTAASRILSLMNHEANPCEDFYEFSCGRVYAEEESTNVLVKHLNIVRDSSPKFLKDFKEFYYSCLEHENSFSYRKRMSGVEALLAEVGQFQLDSQSEPPNLTDLVSQLILRQSMPLFDIGIDVDKQSSNFILLLTLPQQSFLRTGLENWSGLSLFKNQCLQKQKSFIHGTHLNLSDIYDSFHKCQHDYSTYLNSIEDVIRELKVFAELDPSALPKEIQDVRFTIEFEVLNNLDSLPTSADILSTFINKDYVVRKISDLQIHYPIFDWKKLFHTITGHQIQDNSMVQVYFSTYFRQIWASLVRVEKRKLNNAFMAIYAYDLFINTVMPKEKSNRDQFCTDLTKKLLPDVWSYFVQLTYPVREQQNQNMQARNLFEVLKTNFCKSLFEAEWMDDDTKTLIVKKCNNLNVVFFAAPKEIVLDINYEKLHITTNYQTNLINLLTNTKRRIYSAEGTAISAETIFSYFLDPLSSKPLTFYADPTIVVPLGLMKKTPNGLPNYLRMARAGLLLARQMARHFDPTGMKYGIELKSKAKTSYSSFEESMTTMMDHSSPRMFQHQNISFNLGGSLSTNERIVDNAAFKLIFDSFILSSDKDVLPWISKQISRESVFFIATAQELCQKTSMLDFMLQVFEKRHLPAVLRVENIMANSDGFVNEFNCHPGSGMNNLPEKLQFPYLTEIDDGDY